jgi:hypothetical protein
MAQEGQAADLVSSIAQHVGKSFRCHARGAAVPGQSFRSPAAAREAGKAGREPADRAVVLLVDQPKAVWTNSAALLLTNGVACVNIAAYREGIAAAPESQELYRHRIERESVRMTALALGMKSCPFPLCGVSESKTMAELDGKARNLCPHCQGLSEVALKKAGLDISAPKLRPGGQSPP